ncbi:MAG: type II secretion system F family protein [Rhodocyclaceae bacterium]|nr:type II secretion system F family protein [Rhodocyclaceae bacterium]
MALYNYKAVTDHGRMVQGRLDAINLLDLEMRLKRMELDFVNATPIANNSVFNRTTITRPELITFCFHMEQLARAGVPIIESLADLRDSLENPRFREVIAGLGESIEGGKPFSGALEEHPSIFDEVFVSLVRSGEDTGTLPEVLGSLVETLKWQDELSAQTKKLIMYPSFLLVVVIALTTFMMVYLVPQLASFIRSTGAELPGQTKFLLATSAVFVNYWYLLLTVPLVLAGTAWAMVRSNPHLQLRLDEAKLKIPYIGEILRKIILSRFAAVFAMMYQSGITVLDAIKSCEDVVGNLAVRNALRRVGTLIGEGQNVTAAFQSAGLFPPLVIRMIRVGESTGGLDKALRNVSYFYNRDVKESVEKVQSMIEPVMTVTIGIILGWIMLAVLGPIYDIITKLKT